jgi:hypothetical protein
MSTLKNQADDSQITPGWDTSLPAMSGYANIDPGIPNIYDLQNDPQSVGLVTQFVTTANDINPNVEYTIDQAVQQVIDSCHDLRQAPKWSNIYKKYIIKYVDPTKRLTTDNASEDENGAMMTTTRPGSVYHLGNGLDDKIFCFPEVQFEITGSPQELVLTYINEESHKTPAISELEWEKFILIKKDQLLPTTVDVSGANEDLFKAPQMIYKMCSWPTEQDDKRMIVKWGDGLSDQILYAQGAIKFGLDLDGNTIIVEGANETLDVSAQYPFEDLLDGAWEWYNINPAAYGMNNLTWRENDKVSASLHDPDRTVNTRSGIGSFWRLIFNLSAYSAQRLEFYKGSGERVRYITSDAYDLWIARPGMVGLSPTYLSPQTPTVGKTIENGGINSPVWTDENVIVKNDVQQMLNDLDILYDFYSKPRTAFKMEKRIWDENGDPVDSFGLNIGDFITRIDDGILLQRKDVNSYVASIEYILDGNEPRIIVQTEYPDSPLGSGI